MMTVSLNPNDSGLAERARLQVSAIAPSEGMEAASRQLPDADVRLELRDKDLVHAQCSLWWKRTPVWGDHRVGLIGSYFANSDEGSRLVEYACRVLREQGCTYAIGPMDGNTWRAYRFVTRRGNEPRFLFEPDNPTEWVDHFLRCDFQPIARYFSALNEDLSVVDPRIERARRRSTASNLVIRPINQKSIEEDLHHIYWVTRTAFRENLLYVDLEESEFIGNYRAWVGKIPLELILIAEDASQPVGFVFAVPNMLEAPNLPEMVHSNSAPTAKSPIRTVIVKTLAVLPERRYAGLGQMLLAEVQLRAQRMGFERAIHALVRDTPHLRRISARYARPIREYTLFGRTL